MAVVITSLMALLVVAAAVGAVAWLVLRSPESAVDSAERLEPVGTALPAPTEVAEVPTPTPSPAPTTEPEPTALAFSGEQPAAIALPTVEPAPAIVDEPVAVGPTPTPRVIAQATALPEPTLPPVPTLPPAPPVTAVPVVALEPVTQAPVAAPTAAPSQSTNAPQPTAPAPPATTPPDDDPFDIFDTNRASQIVPVQQDPMERVREMQEAAGNDVPVIVMPTFPNQGDRADRDREGGGSISPVLVPTITPGRDGSVEIQVPDVDAMIDEITERATNPDRTPTSNGGRSVSEKDEKESGNRNRRSRNRTPTPRPSSARDIIDNMPNARNNRPAAGNQAGDCPFAHLPENQRPDSPLWDC